MFRRSKWTHGLVASLALASAALGAEGPAPGVEGTWEGALKDGGITLRIALEIARKSDGALAGTLVSIDQGNQRIPAENITFEDHKLHVGVPAAQAQYNGTLNDAGTALTGSWKQGGATLPLNFKRSSGLPVVKRPQEPKKPYPYREEEVAYENAAAGVRLGGTLTAPNGKGPFPAVLLITGSGAQDRDESLLGHKPFLVLADYLTRRGVAVLRVDDRGVGASTGDFEKSTSADFAGDVLAGVRFLKARADIQASHIGLIGHSEGGLIAPIVAVQSPDVAFIVMMAGPGVSGEAILLEQGALIARAGGASEKEITLGKEAQTKMFAVLREEQDPAKAHERLLQVGKEGVDKLPKAKRDAAMKALEGQVKMANGPWMRYFLRYDPVPTLKRVTCPVLAMNGELDLQVPPKQNLPAIEAALKAGGNKDHTLRELPRLNHLFQVSKTGSPAEYAQIEETINPAALDLIGTWVAAHTAAGH